MLPPGRVIGVRGIADHLDRLEDIGEADLALVPPHQCLERGIVDLDAQHTIEAAQVLLVQPDAGRTGDAFEDQGGLLLVLAGVVNEGFLDIWVIVQVQFP